MNQWQLENFKRACAGKESLERQAAGCLVALVRLAFWLLVVAAILRYLGWI